MKKLPIIRHIRYFYLKSKLYFWFETQGRHLGCFINPKDVTYLNDVWKGKS